MATRVTRFGVSLQREFGGGPPPPIRYEDSFSITEMEAIERGHEPGPLTSSMSCLADVNDNWVLWFEDDTLYLNERARGYLCFRVTFERTQEGARVAAAEGTHQRPHLAAFVRFLIRRILLNEDVPCPPERLTKEERGEERREWFLTRWPQLALRLPKSLEYVESR